MKHEFERYCKNYKNIENYDKAVADDFKGWHCHHRLETHTPEGERREAGIGYKELIALGLYYNRPASELIFLTIREHNAFNKGKPGPNKGKKFSEETRRKMAEAHKGRQPMLGKHHSGETRNKMREAHKGNKNVRGKHWYNNSKIEIMAKECPEGFVPGRL